MARKDIIAMILAGGQGARLGVLTRLLAKPAVPFGSRYRVIDFPLSNCANSSIDTVGVLTQYQPLQLNTYIGNGHPWDLDRNNGGAFILPPFIRSGRSEWYKGTANAIFQNMDFIDNYNPEYVLILSGDHIYKMDYSRMLAEHIAHKADATIAVIEVPWAEAPRFGIMTTNAEDHITEFAEKPKKPNSNLASMGIYIFTWDALRRVLIEDDANKDSKNDFGQNIIPKMLDDHMKLVAYRFSGYWKDVGTIGSLWEANMDLLDHPEQLSLFDRSWKIYSKNPVKPAHYIGRDAHVQNSAMTDGCIIEGEVIHSVLSDSVTVERGASVRNSILMPGVTVRAGAVVEKTIVGIGSVIGENARIGGGEEADCPYANRQLCTDGITVVDTGLQLRKDARVPSGCMVESREDIVDNEVIERIFRVV
ncbi:MAG: glucose-1-phosphate adenylyltransferase [Clostridiaceae bacterium]|nr:glucose-1-phosphate adenylyltransferase [Clostridiaceae bacterium]